MAAPKLGIAVGRKRGFPTTPIKKTLAPVKKITKLGKDGKKKVVTFRKRQKFIHDLMEEVCGYAPYEGRVMELLGNVASTHSAEKRPVKFVKSRLGNLRAAKLKVKAIEEMKGRIQRRQKELERKEGHHHVEEKKVVPVKKLAPNKK
jgi:large subunit ribosomal protein L36e